MLFARNLPHGTKKSDMMTLFSQFHIIDATVKQKFKQHRCFAFLTFENPDYCKQALKSHSKFHFNGSQCTLQKYLPQSERESQHSHKKTVPASDYLPNDKIWSVQLLPTDSLKTAGGSTMWDAVVSFLPTTIHNPQDFAVCFE